MSLFYSLILMLAAATTYQNSVFAMRIATYNLRFDSMPDNITVQQSLLSLPDPLVQPAYFNQTGEQPWSSRRIKVAQHLINEGIVMASPSNSRLTSITRA